MKKEEMIYLASKYGTLGYNLETLLYSEETEGKEEYCIYIWDYIEEFRSLGKEEFKKKYKNYKTY